MRWCEDYLVQRAPAERLTFEKAIQRYLTEVTPAKRPLTQNGERKRAMPLIGFFGSTPWQPSRRNWSRSTETSGWLVRTARR